MTEYFKVAQLSRDDVAEMIGKEAANELSDDQMKTIAENIWNELLAEAFNDSLKAELEYQGFEILDGLDDEDSEEEDEIEESEDGESREPYMPWNDLD